MVPNKLMNSVDPPSYSDDVETVGKKKEPNDRYRTMRVQLDRGANDARREKNGT